MNTKLKNTQLIIFDWSGVISDDRYPVYLSNMELLKVRAIKTLTFIAWLEASQLNAIELVYSQGGTGDPDEIHKEYKETLDVIIKKGDTPKIYTGVRKALKLLKNEGFLLAVGSSHPEENLKEDIKNYGLEDYFSYICGNLRDKVVGIKEICKKLNISPESTLYIGDTVFDIKAAKGAGAKSAAITYGYHSRKRLESEKPDLVLRKLSDLLLLLDIAK